MVEYLLEQSRANPKVLIPLLSIASATSVRHTTWFLDGTTNDDGINIIMI